MCLLNAMRVWTPSAFPPDLPMPLCVLSDTESHENAQGRCSCLLLTGASSSFDKASGMKPTFHSSKHEL